MNEQTLTPKQIDVNKIGRDIRLAICKISGKCNTQLRSLVDSYLRVLNPALAKQGSVVFPRSLKRQTGDIHRTTQPAFGDCLCFTIGNAITAYYDAVLDNPFESRLVSDLMELADNFEEYLADGNEREGYALSRRGV